MCICEIYPFCNKQFSIHRAGRQTHATGTLDSMGTLLHPPPSTELDAGQYTRLQGITKSYAPSPGFEPDIKAQHTNSRQHRINEIKTQTQKRIIINN